MGASFNTHPLPRDTSPGAVQRALERLPNFAIPSVQARCGVLRFLNQHDAMCRASMIYSQGTFRAVHSHCFDGIIFSFVFVVQVSRATDALQITFSDIANRGRQPLLDCNPDTLTSGCSSGLQPLFRADSANICPVSRVGEPETDASKDYFEVSTCSSQGICNAESGNCVCFDGFYGLACNMYAQVS